MLGLGQVAETQIDHRELALDAGGLRPRLDRTEQAQAFDPGPDRDFEIAGKPIRVGQGVQERCAPAIVEIDSERRRLLRFQRIDVTIAMGIAGVMDIAAEFDAGANRRASRRGIWRSSCLAGVHAHRSN